jgi:enterochelin esterase-like enzyme
MVPAAPTASPTPACAAERGTWETHSYRGVAVAKEVTARIYLPPCYAETGERYPTAYFLHGKPYTEQQWIDLGLEALLDGKGGAPAAFPGIVVLARVPEPLFSGSDGGPGSYEDEFRAGLMASVEAAFPTQTSASGRALVGISRGGVWALEIGLRFPQDYGTVVALSPALSVNYARPAYDPVVLAVEAPGLPTHLLLAAGEDDWARRATEDLAGRLQERGAAPVLRVIPGAHSDPTWRALLPGVVDFLREIFAQAR